MALLPAICSEHGLVLVDRLISGTGHVTMNNVATNCPVAGCGRFAQVVDGTYELVSDIVRSLRQTASPLQAAKTFQSLLREVEEGQISRDRGAEKAESIATGLGSIINNKGTEISILLQILSLVVAIYAAWPTDRSGGHQEPSAFESGQLYSQLEKRDGLALDEQDLLVEQRRLYELLLKRLPSGGSTNKEGRSAAAAQQIIPADRSGQPNRHERRKAKALARRSPG